MEKFIGDIFPYREVYRIQSDHQAIQVMEDELTHDLALFLDGRCQFHAGDSYIYNECMGVLPSLYCKENPVRALILGGGDGLIAEELVGIGVKDITLVDIDPEVIRVSLEYFNSKVLLSDEVNIYYRDAFEFVKKSSGPYDLIILDYTDPLSNFYCQRLFTVEHLKDIKRLLKSTGALSIQVVAPALNPIAFWCMVKTMGEAFPAANITPLRFYHYRMCAQQGAIILSKSGKIVREIPESCKFLSNSSLLSITSLCKDEYDLEIIDYIPISTVDNLSYFSTIGIPYSRFSKSE